MTATDEPATAEPVPLLYAKLAAPFPPNAIGWKPQTVKENRALAVAYIDARDVQNRLDQAVGPENWWADYQILGNGERVICRLTLRVDGREVTKTDVGGESDQPDGGDRLKAAFSDSLKRAAVQWGVGRYLYYLPSVWCDFDPKSRQIVRPPQLPSWALPATPQTRPTDEPKAIAAKPAGGQHAAPVEKAAPDVPPAHPAHDVDAFVALARAKGKRMRELVAWCNAHLGTGYPETAKLGDLTPDARKALVAELRAMPDAQQQER